MSRVKKTKIRNRKRRKVVLFLFVLFLITVGMYSFQENMKIEERALSSHIQSLSQFELVHKQPFSMEKNSMKKEAIDNRIHEIVSLSVEGKIKSEPFIAGMSKKQEVKDRWGKPEERVEANQLMYEKYSNGVTIGYNDNLVIELRYEEKDFKMIHYQNIIENMGDPDDVSYYKDKHYDQVILGYDVNSNYRLRWIMDRPREDNENNPSLHHISLLTVTPFSTEAHEPSGELLGNMTLDEKICQLVIGGIDGTTLSEQEKRLISDNHIGGFIFYGQNLLTIKQTKKLVNEIKSINHNNKLPLFISVDEEGGRISRLPKATKIPTNKKIGEKNDKAYAYSIGKTLGRSLKELGFNLDYAPVLDINSNPDNPVIGDRSFGDNVSIVSNMGIQTMKGIQSQNIISVVKHFPGHGDTSVDSHIELPTVTKNLKKLQKMELAPFRNAIQNGADVVMVAHLLLPKLDNQFPASMSTSVITDILRNQLHFQGVVMTDDMTMGAVVKHFGIGEAAVRSILAGSDIILVAHDVENVKEVISSIKKAVQTGVISEERINQSVARIIELKKKYLLK